MERVKRIYKKAIRKAQNMYFKDTHESLRALKTKDPKQYWNILNPSAKKKTDKCLIDIDTLQGNFKSLNDKEQSPGQSNHCIADQNTIVSSDVEEFNIPISEEEVVSQIKKIKN